MTPNSGFGAPGAGSPGAGGAGYGGGPGYPGQAYIRSGTLLGAIRGPLLLITLGALIWIDFSGVVSFWRTWPVLMIVFGVLKLAERIGPAAPPLRTGGTAGRN